MVGTWTYDHATNVITVTAGTAGAPCTFLDAWNADKAGTFELVHARNIVAADGAPVAVSHALRPTDYYVQGGANLYITITNFTANGTIRIVGTDANGGALTEDIAFTGNAAYNTVGYYRTVTSTQVTVYANTFTYTFTQGQWGVVWKQSSTQYAFDATLTIGDGSTATYFTDIEKQATLALTGNDLTFITVTGGSTVTLGELVDAATRRTCKGVDLVHLGGGEAAMFAMASAGTKTVYLYSCSLAGPNSVSWGGCQALLRTTARVWNCILKNKCFLVPLGVGAAIDVYNVTIQSGVYALHRGQGTYYNTIIAMDCTYLLYVDSDFTFSVDNLKAYNCAHAIDSRNSWTASGNFIDSEVTWHFNWQGTETGIAYRQYTINLKVVDLQGNAVAGAAVKLTNNVGTSIFSVTTAADGTIAEQTVSRGYYTRTAGDTLQDYSPHTMTISCDGFKPYTRILTLTEPVSWGVKLSRTLPRHFSIDDREET